jgi:hypothetical protein
MLESLEIEEEDSDERYAVQSGEDRRHFEGGGLQNQYHWGAV